MEYFWRKWQVLMWKNLIVRKRHWFLTLFELIIPILLFWVVSKTREIDIINVQPDQKVPEKINDVHNINATIDYGFIQHDKVHFAYCPDNDFTRKLMTHFNETFTSVLMEKGNLLSFDVIESEDKLLDTLHKRFENQSVLTNYIGYGVVFENSNGSAPKNLKYKIRCSLPNWHTTEIFPQFIPDGPNDESDDYLFQGFLAVQMAIDSAFVKMSSGKKSKDGYQFAVQKFPFPAYEKSSLFSQLFRVMMPLFTMLSFVTISISVLKKVVEEKVSGVKELMQMMGLQGWMVWAGWVLNGMMVYVFTCAIITIFLCVDLTGNGPVVSHVHFTIIFALFILFCLAIIFFCFAISTLFTKATLAMTAGMCVWIASYSVLNQYIGDVTLPLYIQFLLCLIPIFNMSNGFIIIAAFQSRGVTMNWLNLFSNATGGNTMSLGVIMLMFLAQMVIYMTITWYITAIHPGPFGRAQPWYFVFTLFSRVDKDKESMLSNNDEDEEHYEAPPTDLRVGLKIHELRKVFGNFVAVDKVNLEIYEGQITALLGHNGAGKTTTMSILTGMYSPTSGTVYAKDYNIFDNMDRFRNSLGLCPQHDLLFPYLTALEHLIFFGMLKGMTKNLARSEGMKLLQMLKVHEKKNVLADKLSGGMKRKVSLAIALIGSPQVLVLDEPTSGMDPESRREMWDLLLSLRKDRTVLITTHFMEEADVLGDRIAIMDHGRVKCYGTTLYLKKIFGTGYQVSVMKTPRSSADMITGEVKQVLDTAEVKTLHAGQITYNVPQEDAAKLAPMFRALEENKESLGVQGIGISCTTMEDVFLKVGQLAREEKFEFDKTSAHSKDAKDGTVGRNGSSEALTLKKVKGVALLIQQFTALVQKRSRFTIRRPRATLIFFLIPLLMTWMTVKNGLIDASGKTDPPLPIDLSLYGDTDAYVTGPSELAKVFDQLILGQGSTPHNGPGDIVLKLLDVSQENLARYKTKVIVAASFNGSQAKALYNGLAFHSAPIAVNLLTNSLLQSNPSTKDYSVTTTNHPLDLASFSSDEEGSGSCSLVNEFSQWLTALIWLMLIPMGVRTFFMDLITFPHNERTSNAKQLQLMSGVPPALYWIACFTWDYFVYILSCVSIMGIILISNNGSLFIEARDYGVFSLIVLLYGVSGISSIYIYSYLGKSSNMASSIFTFVTLVTGVIAPLVLHLLMTLVSKLGNFISPHYVYPLHYLLLLDPQYTFGSAIMNFAFLMSQNSACAKCDNADNMEACKYKPYLGFPSEENPHGLGELVIFLAADWVVYALFILLIEYGYINRAIHRLKVLWVGKEFDLLINEDSDVRDERDRVDGVRTARAGNKNNVQLAPLLAPDISLASLSSNCGSSSNRERRNRNNFGGDDAVVLTVDGLAKKFSRSFAAVQGVSFTVSAGECFGLLGVNGAGKTTTFRMLTGDENPTAGDAYIFNYNLVKNRSKYLSQIGYCPQFDGINEFLTGEEVLTLFANLRGIPKTQTKAQINDYISLLGLDEYRHRRCGRYSGGNKRKLSTAMALIGDPPVVFLDEPTTGVDPVARRNLWDVLGRCQKSGQAIILTSHSMEECEALCTRLTIMVGGRMKCIGTNQYLKQRYGQGYTVMVKLSTKLSADPNKALEQLKSAMSHKFNCTLKDEHTTLLHYHVTDTEIPLSHLFSNMELLKRDHQLIEDYTVSDTTLEQVFIAFARQAQA